MKRIAIITLLGTLATMAPALAQTPPQAPPMAQQHLTRAEAQTETLTALSYSHRVKTQAILADLKAGKIKNVRVAAEQIDAILDANEARDVLTVRDRFFREHRHMRRQPQNQPHFRGPVGEVPGPNMRPEGPPPNRDANHTDRPQFDGKQHGQKNPGMRNDAGLAVIMINLDDPHKRHTLSEHRRPA